MYGIVIRWLQINQAYQPMSVTLPVIAAYGTMLGFEL